MPTSRVRNRVRLRFTTWRLLAVIACVALFLAVLHDLDQADLQAGPPWSAIACMVIFNLLWAAVIIVKIFPYVHQSRERRCGQSRDRLFLPGSGGMADRSQPATGETADAQ